MKVAIIGCGNIGGEIAAYLINRKGFTLHSITDIDERNTNTLINKLYLNVKVISIEQAIAEADLIIEAANKEVVKQILSNKAIDKKKKKLLVMSTGGLIENIDLLYKIKRCELHVPSGAIAGLDAIAAVAGDIESLTLSTTKSPESLEGSPFIVENKIDLFALKNKKTIFKGALKEAIKGFPKNINIAASLFLASKFVNLNIEIVADPSTKFNTHRIKCKGKFGELNVEVINFPSKNPKTSYLAIQSAISVLNNINTNYKIGY